MLVWLLFTVITQLASNYNQRQMYNIATVIIDVHDNQLVRYSSSIANHHCHRN